MTTFDTLLEQHQKVILKYDKEGGSLEALKEVRDFYKLLEMSVNIYCEFADHAKQDHLMWNRKAQRCVELRDLIEKLMKEKSWLNPNK